MYAGRRSAHGTAGEDCPNAGGVVVFLYQRWSTGLGRSVPRHSHRWPAAHTARSTRWNVERRIDRALGKRYDRSEEHTSELQSQSNLVCRLLLEKKKTTRTNKGHKS